MGPIAHIISGAVMGGVVLAVTKEADAAALCAAANVISDTDHFLEYGVYCLKHKIKPRIQEFMSGEYFPAKGTLMVIFHGHEYLLALALICIRLGGQGSPNAVNCIAFTIGYGMHMLLDLIGNDCGLKGYSILYRIAVKFEGKKVCSKKR